MQYMAAWCSLLDEMDFMACGKTQQETCDKLTLPSEYNELPSNE